MRSLLLLYYIRTFSVCPNFTSHFLFLIGGYGLLPRFKGLGVNVRLVVDASHLNEPHGSALSENGYIVVIILACFRLIVFEAVGSARGILFIIYALLVKKLIIDIGIDVLLWRGIL